MGTIEEKLSDQPSNGEKREHRSKLVADLCRCLEVYLAPEQIEQVVKSYEYSDKAHSGQTRKSGEPYIHHPLEAAIILAEMRLDDQTIMAAILHDVIEDTDISKEQLAEGFGEEVADLVDGVSKLTQVQFESKAQAQAENFQKMMLAMVKDIRVILVKLADRIHNMRTLDAVSPETRRRVAKETLDIYVPLAQRLGINTFRLELEELGFANLYPSRYRILSETVKRARGNRKEIVQQIGDTIRERLAQEGLTGEVIGREKHLYSLYQKMRTKNLNLSDVYDVYAFRIVVGSVDACYRTLGVVHNLYKPVPGKFKDYIAIPKSNGYQSLHTVLFGPYSVPIEVQIRTADMDRVAEAGIAAHWLYKTGEQASGAAQSRTREWLKDLLELQKSTGNSLEFIENVKIDLFPDVVYVFTPKGEILELPRGSTPVDFAYAVHTDVGNTCVAAKIDRALSPLSTALHNGQTIEIITAPAGRPNPVWLNFVVTAKARTNIRSFLKNLEEEEAVTLGKRLLEQALSSFSLTIDGLDSKSRDMVLSELRIDSLDQLVKEIGLGNRMALLVARRFNETKQETEISLAKAKKATSMDTVKTVLTRYVPNWLKGSDKSGLRPLAIKGTEGVVVQYARCCRPIPGDAIIGFVTSGRGIVIHVESCKNVAEYKDSPDRWIAVQWDNQAAGEYPVDVRVEVANKRGILATVAAAIAEMGANIENVNIEDRDGKFSSLYFTLNVRDRKHLASVMRHVRALELVAKISRSRN